MHGRGVAEWGLRLLRACGGGGAESAETGVSRAQNLRRQVLILCLLLHATG